MANLSLQKYREISSRISFDIKTEENFEHVRLGFRSKDVEGNSTSSSYLRMLEKKRSLRKD